MKRKALTEQNCIWCCTFNFAFTYNNIIISHALSTLLQLFSSLTCYSDNLNSVNLLSHFLELFTWGCPTFDTVCYFLKLKHPNFEPQLRISLWYCSSWWAVTNRDEYRGSGEWLTGNLGDLRDICLKATLSTIYPTWTTAVDFEALSTKMKFTLFIHL